MSPASRVLNGRRRILRTETADTIILEPAPSQAWSIGGESLLDNFSNPPAPLDFVIPGLLGGTVGLLYGPGSVGKSWLALELAVAVTGGPDISGAFGAMAPGPVVYMGAEDLQIVIRHRLHTLGAHLSLDEREAVAANLHIMGFRGTPPDLLRDTVDLERAADGARLVIIDTLRRFHGGDENDSREMMGLVNTLEELTTRSSTALLLIHHVSKASQFNGTTGAAGAKGSAVLTDHPRWATSLSPMSSREADGFGVKDEEKSWYAKFEITKCNSGPLPSPRWLKRGDGGVLRPASISDPPAGPERRRSRRRNRDEE